MRQIVILEIPPSADQNSRAVNYVLRVPVPAGQELHYAQPDAAPFPGETADELADLQAGRVTELRGAHLFNPDLSLREMADTMQAEWQAFADRVAADPRWAWLGTYWDGTHWYAGSDGHQIDSDPVPPVQFFRPEPQERAATVFDYGDANAHSA